MVHGLNELRQMNEQAAYEQGQKHQFSPDDQFVGLVTNVRKFKEFAKQEVHFAPTHAMRRTLALSMALLREEKEEIEDAYRDNDYQEYVDGLGDLIYVAIGNLLAVGADPVEIMRRICASNETKLGPDATIVNGKLKKASSYTPVDFSDICTEDNKLTLED